MYETIIGLEVHAQLRTATKLFCGCRIAVAEAPNTRTCPVCLGLPGALPVLNTAAVDHAIVAALALRCRVHSVSEFARKNYFYPDLPKGYQITQHDRPLAAGGEVTWSRHGETRRVGIVRLHLEEDAGKSVHSGDAGRLTGIDFNRAGVPLAEIVTAPDLRTPAAAAECFRQLRAILVEAGVCDGNLEAGNLRCDANVSVRPAGGRALGDRIEIKNLNSYRFLQRALEYEVQRQTGLLARGERVEAGTRLWDEREGQTVEMRGKEDAREYRYFPEPDLPPLAVEPARLDALARRVPELPAARAARLRARYAVSDADAEALAASGDVARYFEDVAAAAPPQMACQWVRGEVARRLHESGIAIAAAPVSPGSLARLLVLVDDGGLSVSAAKQVFGRMWADGGSPDEVVEALGVRLDSDPAHIAAWVDDVLRAHAEVVAQHQAGRRGALGFLVGQALRASGGRANPRLVEAAIRARVEQQAQA